MLKHAPSMDGYDFHAGSLSLTNLSAYFHEDREVISESITLTLLFRTIGAAVFGIAGDMYGRKWPMIINLVRLWNEALHVLTRSALCRSSSLRCKSARCTHRTGTHSWPSARCSELAWAASGVCLPL